MIVPAAAAQDTCYNYNDLPHPTSNPKLSLQGFNHLNDRPKKKEREREGKKKSKFPPHCNVFFVVFFFAVMFLGL